MFNRNQFMLEWMDRCDAPTGYEHEIVIPLNEQHTVKLIARYFAYKRKEDFMLACCLREKATTEQLDGIYKNLRLDERANYDIELVEVSWRYESETLHQLQLDMKDRVYIIQKFMPFLKEFLTNGYGGPTPHQDIMVVAMPQGFKYNNMGYVDGPEGQRQRALIAKRVGMGKMKECGWCFAKYGPDLKLQPL